MLSYLRILLSVSCGITCVLLIGFWVRSYSSWEQLHGPVPGLGGIVINSVEGLMSFGAGSFVGVDSWSIQNVPASEPGRRLLFRDALGYDPWSGFGIATSMNRFVAFAPHWFLVLMSAIAAASPWIRWRFSLRTLLVAITFLAVLLGIWAISR
jgi:hypothetical protein